MAGEVHLDALPYIDQGYEAPGVREAVRKGGARGCGVYLVPICRLRLLVTCPPQAMRMVEEETRRYRPTKNYLEFLPLPKTSFEVPSGCHSLALVAISNYSACTCVGQNWSVHSQKYWWTYAWRILCEVNWSIQHCNVNMHVGDGWLSDL